MPTRLPVVLGHEGAGIIEAVGPGVTEVRPGQRVALSWAPDRGRCENCLRELPHLCTDVVPAMFAGGMLDGTHRLWRAGEPVYHYSLISSFAERAVVPAASCIPIGEDIPFAIAALVGGVVATGVGAVWRTARVGPAERVVVFGCGGVGLSAILGARATGAIPVVAVDTRPEKLEAARSVGATDTVLWRGDSAATAAEVRTVTGGGVDFAFEASGRPEAMLSAFESTRVRGTTVLIGLPEPGAVLPLPALAIRVESDG